MKLLLLAVFWGCVGLTLARSIPLYVYEHPYGDDDYHSTTNEDSMDSSDGSGSGASDYFNRYSKDSYEDYSSYDYGDSSTSDEPEYRHDFANSIIWEGGSGQNGVGTLPEENYDDYGFDSETEYDGDSSWDYDSPESSNKEDLYNWPEPSNKEDLYNRPEPSNKEDLYNRLELSNKKDMYNRRIKQMPEMRSLRANTDAISTLLNCTYPRLLQLPAPDYVENSTSTLNRTAFAKAFIVKYTAILSNGSEGDERQGSYGSDSMETSSEEKEHIEWCSLRTEYMLMLIKHTSLSLRKFPSDSAEDQSRRQKIITGSYYKGSHIIHKEAMCGNRSSWLQHEKKCPLTNLTEPVLDLIRLTYNKSLSFPPASSKNNSTNWLARKLIVQEFLGTIKEMMVQGHHGPGQYPHHLHHHGHGHNQEGRHGHFNDGNYAWWHHRNNQQGPKHHHHHGHEPSHHHHHYHELEYGNYHDQESGYGHYHNHESGYGHYHNHESGYGNYHNQESGYGNYHNHEPWHSDSELKMQNASDPNLERGMGNKTSMDNGSVAFPLPKAPGGRDGGKGGTWDDKDDRKWDGGKKGGDKEGGGKEGVGKKGGGKKGGGKRGGGKKGGGKRGGGKKGGGKKGGGKGAVKDGKGNGKGNKGKPFSIFDYLKKNKHKFSQGI